MCFLALIILTGKQATLLSMFPCLRGCKHAAWMAGAGDGSISIPQQYYSFLQSGCHVQKGVFSAKLRFRQSERW